MSTQSAAPVERKNCWLGILVGLVLPIALVPANLYVILWFGDLDFVPIAAGLLAIVFGIVGVWLIFRPLWVQLVVGVIYLPALIFVLVGLQISAGCTILGASGCL